MKYCSLTWRCTGETTHWFGFYLCTSIFTAAFCMHICSHAY